jgi:NTE family protein
VEGDGIVSAAGHTPVLGDSPVFERLSPESSDWLAAHGRLIRLRAGAWLFREGEPAETAYIVRAGRLEVIPEDQAQVIRTVRRNGVIGELALLTRTRRTASVRAAQDSELLEINRAAFEHVLAADRSFTLSLCQRLASQLAANRSPASRPEPPRTIAIVPLEPTIAADRVAEQLAKALGPAGPTTVLRADDCGPSEHPTALIDRARSAGRWVIATAAEPEDPWTNICLAEADRIVALTRGRPTAAWRSAAAALRGCELLVLGALAPEWLLGVLHPRTVQVLADEAAIQRALELGARRLNGRAVGVVLSGGGARAFAHLGVIEGLRAAGVRIDRIAGASMGAVVAGAVAQEMSEPAIYDAFEHYFVAQNPSGDFTVPVYSLLRGGRTRRLLEEGFGSRRIEQLPLRFFCVSSDLNARALVVHRTGPLHEAIFASLAIPGVFPPVTSADGRLLVDGGVLDNLPVETMARDAEGPVIAVDVSHAAPWGPPSKGSGSRWRAEVRSLFTGAPTPLPHLAETMLRTLAAGSRDTVAAARRHADVVITPDVAAIGMLDWKELARVREAGRAAVHRLLEADPDALQGCR